MFLKILKTYQKKNYTYKFFLAISKKILDIIQKEKIACRY